MAAPTYVGNGGIGASDNSATVAVPFPSLQAGDILLLQLLSAGGTDTHQQPTGFTSIGTVNQGTNQTSSWWWKRAVGTESGNLTCSRSNSGDAFFGVMSCWRGACETGTPFNSAGPTSADSANPSSSTITPTNNYCAVICLINEENNIAISNITGFTEAFDVSSSTGDDAEFSANYIYQTTKAQVAAATATLANAQSWATITLALFSNTVTTASATKGVIAVTGKNPTVTVPLGNEPTEVNCTLGTVAVTGYDAVIGEETVVNVGVGGTGKNLFQNPSLEAGITGWTSAYSATLSQSATQAWHGTNSLRVQSGSNWSGGKSPLTSTTESTQYTLSFYIYPVDGSMPFYMDLRDQGSTLFDDLTMGTKPAGTWTRVTKTFTTSAGDTGVYVTIRKDDYAGTDYFYLDGFQIELGASATAWEDYGASGGPEAIVVTGYDGVVTKKFEIAATKGSVAVTGKNPEVTVPAGNVPTVVTVGTTAAVTVTGYDGVVTKKFEITTTKGAIVVAGLAPDVEVEVEAKATKGSVTVTGYDAVVETASAVTASAGAVTVTGYDPLIGLETVISVGVGGTGKNLWVNPSFESGVTGWTGLGYEEVVEQSTDQEWVGTYSLKLTPVDPGNYNGVKSSTRSVVSEATQYTLSFYIYPASGSITYTSTVYNQGDGWEGAESTTYAADQWSRVDITFTTDAGTTGVYLQISQGNVASVVPWYIDGVQLELGASATAWEDYGAVGGPDVITVTGYDTALELTTQVNCTLGTIAVTSHNPDVIVASGLTVSCAKGAVTVTQHAATVTTAEEITAGVGVVTVTGMNPSVSTATAVLVAAGSITVTGLDATVTIVGPVTVSCTLGEITTTGYDAAVSTGGYFVRADGSATKANATGPRTDSTKCMSVATHNAATFSPGDRIYICDDGGDYASELEVPSSGSAGSLITYTALGTPVFDGANDLTGASYKWTASGSGTNEYYCEAAAGGNPSLTEPTSLWLNESTWAIEGTTLGSLTDHQWKWGNNDTLGYNTVYIRDDSGDPDTSGITIDAPQRAPILVNGKSYVTIDGLTVLYANGDWIAGIRVLGGSYVTIQNCTVKYSGNGIALEGTDYGTVDGCTVDTNITHGINVHGEDNDTVTGCEVKNSISANTIQTVFTAGVENGYGIKYMFITNSSIHNCEVYGNDFNGIDLDGGDISAATYCDVYENKIYNNGSDGILVEIGSSNNKLYRNIIYNNAETQDGAAQIRLWDKAQNNEIYGNVIYLTNADAAGTRMIWIGSWDDARSSSGTKIYNNTIDGGGISTQGIYLAGNATPSNTLVKNNIVANMASGAYFITGSDFTGMTFDYNCIEATGNLIFYNAGWASWATWQALPQDTHSYNADPAFKDAANGKFYLTSSSPCIDVGTDLGATYDDGIDPRILGANWPSAITMLDQDSWGTGWEIGAYVYDYVDAATVTIVGYDPTVTVAEGVTVTCTLGTISGVGRDPTVTVSEIVLTTAGAVTATAFDATLALPERILAASGAVAVTALQPEVEVEVEILAGTGTVTVTGYNPTVTTGLEVIASCTLGTITVTGLDAACWVPLGVDATLGTVVVTGHDALLNTSTIVLGTELGEFQKILLSPLDAVVQQKTAVAASVAAGTVTGYDATVWAPTGVSAGAGAISVVGYDPDVAIIQPGIPVTLGTVTVLPVSPAFAMKDWYPKRIDAQSKPITLLGKAASIIAPIIAATLGTVTVTGHAAEIHEAHIEVACTAGSVAVTGHNVGPHIVGVEVAATCGTIAVTGYDAAGEISAIIKADSGAVTVTGHHAVVAKTAVWATPGQVLLVGYDPAVVAPLVAGEAIGTISDTSKRYISYYQDWATHFPAEIARRWRQFLLDTFYIATPPVTVGGTANSLELTTDEEIVQITPGQSLRFTAAYTNTGGTILDVNEIGPQSVLYEGQPLKGGEIVAGGSYEVVFDGIAWGLTTSSRAVVGSAAKTWMNSGKGAAGTSWEVTVWGSETEYDDAAYFYGGMMGIHTIEIPENGRYRINGVLGFEDVGGAAGHCDVRLELNGVALVGSEAETFADFPVEGDVFVHFEYVGIFNTGDRIQLFARQIGSAATYYIGDDDDSRRASWWAIERLR